MEHFKPYHIVHIDIAGLLTTKLEQGNYYLVFYYNNIPLGHIYLTDNHALEDCYTDIFEAIYPAVSHYAGQSDISIQPDTKENFIRGSQVLLLELLRLSCFNPPALEHNTISVIVCTRNRPEAIAGCIEKILDCQDKDFEIIVVDNAPEDNLTQEAVQRFPNVKYVLEPRKGLDIARNTGARHASGSIIAYTDDDVCVNADWIGQLRTCFNDPMTMAVTGLVLPLSLDYEPQYLFEKNWGFNKGYIPKVFDHNYFKIHYTSGMPVWEIGAGANMAFRSQVFQFAGGFDERLDVGASGCSGDSEMWHRIIAEGWTCRYFPHLVVHHQHRKTREELRNQLFAYMRGHVSAILVQYEKYGHPGDRRRVCRSLPKYYLNKIWNTLRQGKFSELQDIYNETAGALSGWKFYLNNKLPAATKRKFRSLYEPVDFKAGNLVSVVIPCYNHAHYLSEAIESILNQDYPHVEVVVVDDGSTDDTAGVCKKYPMVKYFRTERAGLSAARNFGVKNCEGQYVIFLDADDFLPINAISTHIEHLLYSPTSVFISGAHQRIDEHGDPLPVAEALTKWGYCYDALLQGNYIAMEGSVMYRRELFHAFAFDTTLTACEDYDLNLRITRHFHTFTHQKLVAVYRIHSHNMSANTPMMLQQVLKVLEKQIPFLRTSHEKECYEKGVQNWQFYYSQKSSG